MVLRLTPLFIGITLFCQTAIASNLMDIYHEAEEHDAELASAESSFFAQQEVVPQSRSALLPNVNFSTEHSNNRLEGNDINGTDRYDDTTHSVELRQALFRANSWFNLQNAQALSDQAESNYSAEQQDLIFRVADAYFSVLRAQDNLASSRSEETALQRQLDRAEQRFQVGLIAITDVHEAQAAFDIARVARIEDERDIDVSFEELEKLTARSYPFIASLSKEMGINPPSPNNRQTWVDSALQNNLSIIAAQYSVEAAQNNLSEQKSGHLPTIDLVASYNDNQNESFTNFSDTEGRSIGVELNLPLYQGGETSSRVRQAYYQLEQSQYDLELIRRTTLQDIRSLFRTVNTDVLSVAARQQAIISNRSALEATQAGYDVGTRDIVDVLNAQRSLYAAIRDHANARYDYVLDTLELHQTAGTLSPDHLEELNVYLTDVAVTGSGADLGEADELKADDAQQPDPEPQNTNPQNTDPQV